MSFEKFFIENDIIKGMGSDTVGAFDIDGVVNEDNTF